MKKITIQFLLLAAGYLFNPGAYTQPANWQPRGVGGGGAFFAPSINPANEDEFYVGSDMSELFHTLDFGQQYDLVPFTATQGGHNSKVCFTNNPQVMYSIDYASGPPGYSPIPVKTTNGGTSWAALSGNPDPSSEAYSIWADYNQPDHVILSFYGEIHYSTNGGTTFSLIHTAANSGSGIIVGGVFFDGSNIFIGTNDGLLVSTNGGTSFSAGPMSGIPGTEGIFSFCAAKSGNTTRLFCLTGDKSNMWCGMVGSDYWGFISGVYSMDYGSGSWTNRTSGINLNDDYMMFIACAQNDINTVYLAGSNGINHPNLMKSTNAGGNWTHIFNTTNNQNIITGWCGQGGDRQWTFPECPFGIAVAPNNSQKLIFTDYSCIHKSSDGGTTWKEAYVEDGGNHPAGATTPPSGNYQSVGLENTTCWQVFWVDSTKLISCFSDIKGIRSNDGGNSWTMTLSGYSANSTYRIVRHPQTGTLYAATSNIHDMYQSTRLADAQLDANDSEGKIIFSTDGGSSWQTLHLFNHPVFWIALDPNNPNTLYASVIHSTQGGIFKTNDLQNGAAANFTQLPAPPRTQGHPACIVVLNDGKVVCTFSGRRAPSFTASSGCFVYDPTGNSWSDVSDPGMHYWTKDIILDPNDATQNTWYVCVFSGWGGPPNGLGGLYRTTNRGSSWTRITGTQFDRVTSITFHPQNQGEAYLTTEGQGLWRTTNLGDASPAFNLVSNYYFRQPERVYFNPYDASEIWVTSFGNGLKMGSSSGPVSMDEPKNRMRFQPWPNPSRGECFVNWEDASGQYTIYDLRGRVRFSGNMLSGVNRIPTGGLEPGLYLLEAENGKEKFSAKMLVE